MDAGELLLVIGPPAVGKMTVGRAICARSDFRLFHNHHTVEPLLEVFGYGTPPFETLNLEFRRRVIEEAAAADLKLIFTLVWGVENPADADYVRQLMAPYLVRQLRVSFVELYAGLETRLVRNVHEERVDHKRSKRDLAWSEANVRELERHRLNTEPGDGTPASELLAGFPHLRVDNTDLSADEVAARVLEWRAG